MKKTEKLLTESEAAKILNVSTFTLTKLRKSSDTQPPVPAIVLGGLVRYEHDALMNWVRAHSRGGKTNRGTPRKAVTHTAFVSF